MPDTAGIGLYIKGEGGGEEKETIFTSDSLYPSIKKSCKIYLKGWIEPDMWFCPPPHLWQSGQIFIQESFYPYVCYKNFLQNLIFLEALIYPRMAFCIPVERGGVRLLQVSIKKLCAHAQLKKYIFS